jgi:hypothetical protein
VALVVAILSLILAWLAYQQDRAEYARPDPPPSPPAIVQQQPDPAEIDRRVDERLREREIELNSERGADHPVPRMMLVSPPSRLAQPTGGR